MNSGAQWSATPYLIAEIVNRELPRNKLKNEQ
jgi:hypothetical protein